MNNLHPADNNLIGGGSDFNQNTDVQDGRFQIEVPAGSYRVHGATPEGLLLSTSGASIALSSDISDVGIALAPLPSVPVRVRTQSDSGGIQQIDAGEALRLVGVLLHSVSNTASLKRADWGRWNPLKSEIQNVEPGVYEVELNTFGQWRVESARCGSLDLLSENLTITDGAQPSPIEITLRNDAATVNGTVVEAEGELASVLLAQQYGTRNLVKLLPRVQGVFQFKGLAPGDYALIVSDGLDKLEYMNPDVLNPYLTTAVHLSLHPHGTANVNLTPSAGNR
jgi:hypothetical protein